jgi:NADH-quinone oxidoreductase subunit B
MDEIDHSSAEFLNARKEMERLTAESLKKYDAKPNALFGKLSELLKAMPPSGDMVKWARKNSLWPMQFGLACCAMELMDFGAARIDAERKGYLLFRPSPRQCDVMIIAGWVTKSMIPEIKRLYEQMAEPKHVIAFGECATSGGPWWESYNIIRGIDQVIPVDVYTVGCPPRPENLFQALIKLQEKLGGKIED